MKRFSFLISRYLIQAIVPYFIFSWLLLSVILFVQQAGRFSDIFFSVNIPANLVWQLTIALIPNVISFTCPMAVLVGTIIGLSKMQGDSELVAIRAAGVGNLQIAIPVVVLGILLSLFSFLVNLKGVPLAAALVRQVALKTAIQKLESPIEPGVFNTEIAGYTIYVKGGDIETGRWNNIFIYNEDAKNGSVRLITSNQGRIDVTDQSSELVLENATVSTFPLHAGEGKYVSENIGEIRLAIKTRRGELIERLSSTQGTPEELGLSQLSDYAASREGKDRIEAQILWQRRITLSIAPLIFCLLGTAMILRFSRGGRGFGTFLALSGLVSFYLLAFLGEQLARVGNISAFGGSLIPVIGAGIAIVWFGLSSRLNFWSGWLHRIQGLADSFRRSPDKLQTRNFFVDLTTGLRDLDLVLNLAKFFVLTLVFLILIFTIFTAFELWKFAGTMDGGVWLLIRYLFFLLPFMYLQLAPSAAMVATLATYVIKSRQNEIVTWISSGQSVYRLLAPCFLVMAILGVANWQFQERVLPAANIIQDDLRTRIRSRGAASAKLGKYWVAGDNRIYSFELGSIASDEQSQSAAAETSYHPASDNEIRFRNINIYEFSNNWGNLQFVYRAAAAKWRSGRLIFDGPVEKSSLLEGSKITVETLSGGELVEASGPFSSLVQKPSYMTSSDLSRRVDDSDSDTEQRLYSVTLQRRYSTPFLPLIIALFTAPFALSLSRKGKVITVGYAVGLWLLFTGVTNVFEQFGLNGFLSPPMAVWGPLAIFSMLGIYLLSKVRT